MYGNRLETIDLAYPQLVRDVLPSYAWGFFLAVLLGAVFSSFNSLLNSAATLFCLDVYEPLAARTLTDTERVIVAKRASVVIALFSFAVAPMLQHASEGLWQVIRIFTGFYNIPVIAIVVVGLFTTRVPAVAAKVVIVFHVVSYGCLQFLFKEQLPLHFLHLYAILFVIEVCIMLVLGWWRPRRAAWTFHRRDTLDPEPLALCHSLCRFPAVLRGGALFVVFPRRPCRWRGSLVCAAAVVAGTGQRRHLVGIRSGLLAGGRDGGKDMRPHFYSRQSTDLARYALENRGDGGSGPRLVIIGVGMMGREHLRVAALLGRARLRGIYDASPDSIRLALADCAAHGVAASGL